jgi:hypothetical protein
MERNENSEQRVTFDCLPMPRFWVIIPTDFAYLSARVRKGTRTIDVNWYSLNSSNRINTMSELGLTNAA